MKEFNIERAMNGAPVLDRDGNTATYGFSISNTAHGKTFHLFKMISRVNGNEYFNIVDDDGLSYESLSKPLRRMTCDDLFMAPVKKQEWANVYKSGLAAGYSLGTAVFGTQEEALKNKYGSEYVTTVLIREWEE